MSTFFLMCWEFFKTGLFAVGGGLATVPFLQEMGDTYGWFTTQELTTMIAVSESTPGPMGINMATYVGNHMFGIWGGIAATLSEVAPAIIIICIIYKVLEKFKEAKVIQGIFSGLRPAVAGFILAAVVSIYLLALFHTERTGWEIFNWKAILFFAILLAFYKWRPKTHPILIILISAVAGLLIGF